MPIINKEGLEPKGEPRNDLTFEAEESKRDTNFKRGDTVKMYKEDTVLQYPHIMLSCEKLEMFRVEAMKGILGKRSLIIDETNYAVYINMQGQVIQVGVLPNTKLRILLSNKVFDVFDKEVKLDKDTTVSGDMLFALCTAVI